jgi:hypothetical protein
VFDEKIKHTGYRATFLVDQFVLRNALRMGNLCPNYRTEDKILINPFMPEVAIF